MRQPTPQFTVDEYLTLERASEERHEYLDGQIYAMAGESDEHGDISMNLYITVGSQLKGKPCRAKPRTTPRFVVARFRNRGAVPAACILTPILSWYAAKGNISDAHTDVLLNPTVIMEVLSPSTEAFDRGEKFRRYETWNPTLKDYLLVAHRISLKSQALFPTAGWGAGPIIVTPAWRAMVPLPSIDCTLKLVDVYDRIVFPSE